MIEWCEGCDNRDVVINRLVKEKEELQKELEELKKRFNTHEYSNH